MSSIRNIAVGLPVRDGHVLLSENHDRVRDLRFHPVQFRREYPSRCRNRSASGTTRGSSPASVDQYAISDPTGNHPTSRSAVSSTRRRGNAACSRPSG
ncbi:hypothetical protein AAEP80_11855 [Curtobacterium sp. L3-7]|uniref:hypothetical protein n=1 Tax=Curtobacterium sp. L3-7 TaxID=3138787 RepID=UPI003B52C423